MKRDILSFFGIIILGTTYVVAYDFGRISKLSECHDEILVRDIQMKSMLAIERRLNKLKYSFKE